MTIDELKKLDKDHPRDGWHSRVELRTYHRDSRTDAHAARCYAGMIQTGEVTLEELRLVVLPRFIPLIAAVLNEPTA